MGQPQKKLKIYIRILKISYIKVINYLLIGKEKNLIVEYSKSFLLIVPYIRFSHLLYRIFGNFCFAYKWTNRKPI